MESLLPPLPKWLIATFAVAALVGFADSSYLTAQHMRGALPPCTVVLGCEQVLTSRYATIAGMPVSALGMLYYGTLLVALIAYIDIRDQRIIRGAAWLTVAGFVGTLYFLYLQAFVLHVFCQYCLLSACTSFVLVLAGTYIIRKD
jgi:uncharacterized membrane protein